MQPAEATTMQNVMLKRMIFCSSTEQELRKFVSALAGSATIEPVSIKGILQRCRSPSQKSTRRYIDRERGQQNNSHATRS